MRGYFVFMNREFPTNIHRVTNVFDETALILGLKKRVYYKCPLLYCSFLESVVS